MVEIRLRNSRTRSVVPLEPTVTPGKVGMYVCGPTVYDRAHLGNARPVIVFDVLYRLLRHVYGADNVTYVRNFTDVDDKINARAAESGRSIGEITAETTQWFLDDMKELGALDPDHMPRATEYIPQMVAMIETLLAEGHAYPAEGHVLFRVRKYKNYGALSGRSVDDMIAGARVEKAPYKEDPMDFVLWKPSSGAEPGWPGPRVDGVEVSHGRPGWHIECSAMAKALLGDVFDIHGGGNDLMFPHHENEIAQSCCANHTDQMARIWMHNEMLQVEGKKMSKSLGNFFTVRDLLDQGVPGEVIRFVFLSTHYSKPMDWTEEKRERYTDELSRWRLASLDAPVGDNLYQPVIDALAKDLNTWEALVALRRLVSAVEKAQSGDFYQAHMALGQHPHSSKFSNEDALKHVKGTLLSSAQLLGLLTPELGGWEQKADLSNFGSKLSRLRGEAKETKDFTAVDALKSALTAAGVEVRMSKDSVELIPGPNFDPAKLEGLL